MMHMRKQLFRRSSAVALLAIFGIATSLGSLLLPATAHASGETYKWTSVSQVTASGGSLTHPAIIGFQNDGSGITGNGSTIFQTSTCRAYVIVSFKNNTIGRDLVIAPDLSRPLPDVISPQGSPPPPPKCTSSQASSAPFTASVRTTNDPPQYSGQENAAEKTLHITLESGLKNSPTTAHFTVTSKTSGNKYPLTATRQNGSAYLYSYSADLTDLVGGNTYKVCVTDPVFSGVACKTFTKEKFTTAYVTFQVGSQTDHAENQHVSGSVILESPVFSDWSIPQTLGTYVVDLQTADGSQTLQTKSVTIKYEPSKECQNSGSCGHLESISKGYDFSGVAPGKYKVCVEDTNVCQDITRKIDEPVENVDLNLSQDAQDAAESGGGQTQDDADTCNVSTSLVSWFLCPIYDGLANLSDALLTVVQDFLKTNPIDTTSTNDNAIYTVWSNFRIYGDIFLIIALLVVVFGQSIGGGLVDAYTAKKVLPRLLVAAILINLSIYIVAFMVDVTNIIGQSIGGIITAPMHGVSLSPSGWKLAIFAALPGAAIAGGATIAAFLAGGAALGSAAVAFMPFLLLFVIVPALLALILLFVILVLRKAIIIALVLISPIAFALYALPNTEQYFRKWWKLLFDMLMVYPVVMVIFGVADLLAYTVIKANGTASYWGYFIAFLLQFLPLLMIPYAMKVASGALGQIHDLATERRRRGMESVKGNVNDPWSRRNRAKRGASNAVLSTREKLAYDAIDRQKKGTAVGGFRGRMNRRLNGAVAGIAGMGNYQEQRSRRNAEAAEMLKGQVATGDDSTVRALFAAKGSDGKWRGTGGREYSEYEVNEAKKLYGKNPSLYQAALTYELGKAANDGELENTMGQHQALMNDPSFAAASLGRGGIWAGAKYSMQGTRRELKHTSELESGTGWVRDSQGHTQEIAETVGTYPLGNMRVSTIDALTDDYNAAKEYQDNLAIAEDKARSPAEIEAAKQRLAEFESKDGATVYRTDENGNKVARKVRTKFANATEAQKTINNAVATAKTLDSRRQLSGRIVEQEGDEAPGVQSGAAGKVEEKLSQFVATVRNQGDLPSGPPPTGNRQT
jgi:hypothetical protein